MIDYNIISTGSKGNAVIINGRIMIDCGVSFAALRKDYLNIDIVLLTHIHSDHFKKSTIKKLSGERPSLRFACCKWLFEDVISCGVNASNIDVLATGVKYDYEAFMVEPFKLYHNAPNCGYKLYIDGKKVFYATDTATLDKIKAENFDLYMVEANYEQSEILERINEKRMNGKYSYEKEVLKNHLSRADCDAFLDANKGPGSRVVYLHQHINKGDEGNDSDC